MSVVDLSNGAFSVTPVEDYVGACVVVDCNGCEARIFEGSSLDTDRTIGLGELVLLAGAHIGQCPVLSVMTEVKL